MRSRHRTLLGTIGLITALAACEAIVGADFDPKTLSPAGDGGSGGDPPTVGGGGSGAQGGSGGSIEPLLDDGEPCSRPDACLSGFCTDGVCCESSCTSECQHCAEPAQEGTCVADAYGAPCPDSPGGTCDGVAFCVTGALAWRRRIGGETLPSDPISRDYATSCGLRPDGQMWVTGSFDTRLSVPELATTLEANYVAELGFLLRLDADGEPLTITDIGTNDPLSDTFEVSHLSVAPDGGVVLVGLVDGTINYKGEKITGDSTASSELAFVLAIGPDGEYLWHDTYQGGDISSLNGDEDYLRVDHGPNGEVVVAGSFEGTLDLGSGPVASPGAISGFVVAYEPTGTRRWTRIIDGPPSMTQSGPWVFSRDVAVLPNGDVALVGHFTKASIVIDGNTVPWIGDESYTPTDVYLIMLDGLDGGYVTGGAFGDEGGSQWSAGLAAGPDGTLLLGGSFASSIQFGDTTLQATNGVVTDTFLTKLTVPTFGESWPAKVFKSTGSVAKNMYNFTAIDPATSSLVTGRGFAGQNVGPHVVGSGVATTYLSKIAPNGDHLWHHELTLPDGTTIPPDGGLRIADVTAGADGRVGICGFAIDDLLLDGNLLSSSLGGRDVVVLVFEP